MLVDRLEWPVSVGGVGAVAGVAWYSLGRALAVPHVFADELIHTEAARNLALHGSLATHGYGFVTPAIDSLTYLVTPDGVAAHRLLQATNVAVMVTTAFLAYPLARRAMSSGWALVVAALTPAVPWMTYARFVLTEPDFYPVFLLFALFLVRALERPTLKRQMLLLAALVLTYLTRTQAVVLAGAVVCAVPLYGIAQGHALLASVSLLSESAYGQGSVHERDLFFAAPLVISCAIAWATNGCPRPKLLTAVTAAAAVGCAASIPSGAITLTRSTR